MRRSQLAAVRGFKSPFVSPVKKPAADAQPAQGQTEEPKSVTTTAQPAASVPPPLKKPRASFQCPVKTATTGTGTKGAAVATTPVHEKETELPSRAFQVFWTTFSKKKHKTFADGILVLNGVAAKLLDEEGKELAKCSNMGRSNVETLVPGNTLLIQSKELEINKQIPYEEYSSGRVFVSVGKPTAAAAAMAARLPKKSTLVAKPFKSVVEGSSDTPPKLPAPRYDPTAPNALVLQPGSADSVAVVVDPYISQRLRPHQRDGIQFVYDCVMGRHGPGKGCILADEMGLGKSLQALTVLWTLLKQGPQGRPLVRKAIIVCPNTLIGNWVHEITLWLGSERLVPLTLSSAKSKSDCSRILREFKADKNPVLIISYEQLRSNVDALRECQCGFLICDEAHRIKNAQSKTAIALTRLSTERRVLLTGTPVQNDLTEFYTMVEFCSPSLLGTLAAFRNTFETPIALGSDPAATPEQRELARQRSANLEAVTSSVVLRRLSTILSNYLPHKTELVLVCRPTEAQVALYKVCLSSKSVRRLMSEARGDTAVPSLSCIHRLTKICGHPGLLLSQDPDTKELLFAVNEDDDEEDGNGAEEEDHDNDDEDGGGGKGAARGRRTARKRERTRHEDDGEDDDFNSKLSAAFSESDRARLRQGDPLVEMSGKLLVLDRLMAGMYSGSDEKIVLVSNFTKTLDWFERLCRFRGYEYRRLDGSTDKTKRQQLVDYFNKSSQKSCFAFLLSCKAGGLGINLCGANRLVLFDPDWNPAWDRQSMARIWRDGQKRPVIIYRMLTTGTIEEKIFQRQLSKQSLSRNVIIDTFESSKGFSRDDLKAVFTLNEHTSCDTHDLIGCRCADTSDRPRARNSSSSSSDASECTAVLSRWSHFSHVGQDGFPDPLLVQAMAAHPDEISFAFASDSTEVARQAPQTTTVHSEAELSAAREAMAQQAQEEEEKGIEAGEACAPEEAVVVPDPGAELDAGSSKEAAAALFDFDDTALGLSP